MLLFTEDGAAIDIMQKIIIVIGFVGVSAIVIEYISGFLGRPAFWFRSNADGGSLGFVGRVIASTTCSPSNVNIGLRKNLRIVVQ